MAAQYIAVYVIKHQHTTCFLLLLRLQFQKLGRFQKRFDAHFCAVTKTAGSLWRRKGAKERWSHREDESEHQSGRGPRLRLEKERVIWFPLTGNSATHAEELQTRWRSKWCQQIRFMNRVALVNAHGRTRPSGEKTRSGSRAERMETVLTGLWIVSDSGSREKTGLV